MYILLHILNRTCLYLQRHYRLTYCNNVNCVKYHKRRSKAKFFEVVSMMFDFRVVERDMHARATLCKSLQSLIVQSSRSERALNDLMIKSNANEFRNRQIFLRLDIRSMLNEELANFMSLARIARCESS